MTRSRRDRPRRENAGDTARAQPVPLVRPVWNTRSAMSILVAILSTVFMLALTVPWIPVRGLTIGYFDYSWMAVLHDAVANGRQFGSQLIVPYGPLGFIATNIYDPRTFVLLMCIRVVLSLTAMRVLWEAARTFFEKPIAALPWMAGIILMMGPGISQRGASVNADPRMLGGTEDHFFSICAVLTLGCFFVVHRRAVSNSLLAMVALLSAASLAKVNFLMQDLVVVVAITFDQLRGKGSTSVSAAIDRPAGTPAVIRKKPRWIVPALYAACLIVFYLAARQSPANVGAFVRSWVWVTLGHMDAVGLPGSIVDVIAFVIIAAIALLLIGGVEWTTHRRAALTSVAAMAALFALLYKHSFVRQDFAHATIGPMVVFAAVIFYLPIAWRMSRRSWQQGICLAAFALAAVVVWSSLSSLSGQGLVDYVVSAGVRTADAFNAAANDITFPHDLQREWDAQREHLREENPLATALLRGPADVYPHRQDVLLAYGLEYDPRPAFSSLFATAPALAELNRQHLLSARAPQTILFDIEPVDQQFPSLADGWSWPELLTRYDIVDRSGALLILRRTDSPRAYRFAATGTISGEFNKPVAIPPMTTAALWARIHLRRRTGGSVVSALHKPPMVQIEVWTRDRAVEQYRLLPALAEQGFLLSPLVKDRRAFSQLASKGWAAQLGAQAIEILTLSVVDGSEELNYNPRFTIEIDRLEMER